VLLKPFSFSSTSVTASTSIDAESDEITAGSGEAVTCDRTSGFPFSVSRTFGSEEADADALIAKQQRLGKEVTGNRRLEVETEGVKRRECSGRATLEEEGENK